MNGTGEIGTPATAGDEQRFDPQQAAQVLLTSKRKAQRQFSPTPPLVTTGLAVVILGAYVALYLSTRDQHPYRGPGLGVVALVYAAVAVTIAVSTTMHRRARKGVTGPSVRQQKLEGVAIGLSYLCSPMIQGAMKHYDASHTIVYGVIPAAGPLLAVGTTVFGLAVAKQDAPQMLAALAVVLGGFVALFVGPSGAWLAAGAGLFVGVVTFALTTGRPSLRSRWAAANG